MKINLFEMFLLFLKKKLIIIAIFFLSVVIGVLLAFLLPKKYRIETKLIPPLSQAPSLYTMLGGVENRLTSSIANFNIPGFSSNSSIMDLLEDICRSRMITEFIVDSLKLKQVFTKESKDEAIEELLKITTFKLQEDGTFSIIVEYENPQIALEIAKLYLNRVNWFINEESMTKGKQFRIFIEGRIKDMTNELNTARDSFVNYQKRYSLPMITSENLASSAAFSNLQEQMFKKEILLNYFKTGQSKLNFTQKPGIVDEYLRRYYKYRLLQESYAFLLQQLEQAKMMENKDTPVLTVLQRPFIPEKPFYPKKKLIILAFLLIGAAISILYIFVLYIHDYIKKDPQANHKWEMVKKGLRFK